MSMSFDTNGPAQPLPTEPLSPEVLAALGFVRIKSSSEPQSYGSYALKLAFFEPPSFEQLVQRIREQAFNDGQADLRQQLSSTWHTFTRLASLCLLVVLTACVPPTQAHASTHIPRPRYQACAYRAGPKPLTAWTHAPEVHYGLASASSDRHSWTFENCESVAPTWSTVPDRYYHAKV